MARLPNIRFDPNPSWGKPNYGKIKELEKYSRVFGRSGVVGLGRGGSTATVMTIHIDRKRAKKVAVFLDEFPYEVEAGFESGAWEFAEKIHRIVTRCLKTGTPPKGVSWPPHSAVTTKMLGSHKLLNLTGFYLRHIEVGKNKSREFGVVRGTIYVGLPKNLKRPSSIKGSSRLTMREIAEINEYGGGKVPARPLWRPAYRQAGGAAGLRKATRKWVKFFIKEAIKSHGLDKPSRDFTAVVYTPKTYDFPDPLPKLKSTGVHNTPLPGIPPGDDLPF